MPRRIPHDLRLELYKRVKELHNQGIGYRKIQKIIENEFGVWISRSNISYWVRGLHSPLNEPYNKPDFSRPEMAWIAGMYMGDGSIKITKDGRTFTLKVMDRELVEEAASKLATIMRREKPYAVGRFSDGRYYVEVQSRELVDHLLDRENVLAYLKRMPREFIRAFFDCEGYVLGTVNVHGTFCCGIGSSNTDLELLKMIRDKLKDLGIESKIVLGFSAGRIIVTSKGRTVARKDCYAIRISGYHNIIRFYQEIGFSIPRKMNKLLDVVDIRRRFKGKRAAIEWIRRYEYRKGEGRTRWFKRDRPLTLKEALKEYERFVSSKRSARSETNWISYHRKPVFLQASSAFSHNLLSP